MINNLLNYVLVSALEFDFKWGDLVLIKIERTWMSDIHHVFFTSDQVQVTLASLGCQKQVSV